MDLHLLDSGIGGSISFDMRFCSKANGIRSPGFYQIFELTDSNWLVIFSQKLGLDQEGLGCISITNMLK